MELSRLLLATLLVIAVSSAAYGKNRSPVLRQPAHSPKTGCYIIAIKEKATEEEMQALLTAVVKASNGHKMYGLVKKASRLFTVKLSPYSLEMVRGMPAVDYIEEEGFATGDATGNVLQWHLDRLDQVTYPLDLSYAPIGDGEGVDIYILDSGINFDHSEFDYRAKYVGYDPVDEYTLNDLENLPDNYQRQNGRDCHGHGTHVASLSAGRTYGTAKKATVYSVRVLNCNNAAPWSIVLDGLDKVLEQAQRTKRPSVASLSLSGNFYRSVNDAVAGVVRGGVHVVVAAGNGGVDSCSSSPASSSSAITVGGSSNGDGFYLVGSGSNFGSCVDIFAPGETIVAADWKCSDCCKTLSGTSMSTPIVSGVVAVHLSRHPMASPRQIKQKLIDEALLGVLSLDGVIDSFHENTANRLLHMSGSCGGTNFLYSSTVVTSPNYPSPYPSHLDCIWHIKVPKGIQVVVKISTVSLEANYDVLRLYEGACCNRSHQVAQFTGDLGSVEYAYTSLGSELSLQLVTDGIGSSDGFTGSFTKVYSGTNIRVPDIEVPTVAPVLTAPSHIISLRSLSPKRTRSEVKALLDKGYKVTWITTHLLGTSKTQAFDILLSNSTNIDTRVFIDLTAAALREAVTTMTAQGYSISSLADRERGKAPNLAISYTALFRRSNHLLETELFLGDSVEDWKKRIITMNNSDYRLVSQSFTHLQGREKVSTIFTRDRRLAHNITFEGPPKMFSFTNATFFEFTHLTLNYARKSYYLTHLEVNQRDSDTFPRFSAILVAHTSLSVRRGNWFRWGLNEEAITTMIHFESPNWDPYVVNGYSHQGEAVFYVGFQRHVS